MVAIAVVESLLDPSNEPCYMYVYLGADADEVGDCFFLDLSDALEELANEEDAPDAVWTEVNVADGDTLRFVQEQLSHH